MNFVAAVAYHFCLNLPAAFTKPGEKPFGRALNSKDKYREGVHFHPDLVHKERNCIVALTRERYHSPLSRITDRQISRNPSQGRSPEKVLRNLRGLGLGMSRLRQIRERVGGWVDDS